MYKFYLNHWKSFSILFYILQNIKTNNVKTCIYINCNFLDFLYIVYPKIKFIVLYVNETARFSLNFQSLPKFLRRSRPSILSRALSFESDLKWFKFSAILQIWNDLKSTKSHHYPHLGMYLRIHGSECISISMSTRLSYSETKRLDDEQKRNFVILEIGKMLMSSKRRLIVL